MFPRRRPLGRTGASAKPSIEGSRRPSGSAGGRALTRWRALVALVAALGLVAAIILTVASGDMPRRGQRPVALRPSGTEIAQAMWRTVLTALPLEHFVPAADPTSISDGSGGQLTADVGAVLPTTDGDGQLVFFWHNHKFVGWDSSVESMLILQVAALGSKNFQVTYANFAPNDPACCPSLIPVSVVYRWDGHHFLAQGQLPLVGPVPGRVRLLP